MLLLSYFDASKTKDLILEKKRHELLEISSILKDCFHLSLEEILIRENAFKLDTDQQAQLLSRHLQPLVTELSKTYPGYELGFHSQELGRVLAFAPNLKPDFLTKPQDSAYQEIYNLVWGNQPALCVSYPVYLDGKLIGHTWSSYKTTAINKEFYLYLAGRLILVFVLWLAAASFIWLIFQRIESALKNLATQILKEDDSKENFKEFPELLPILDTIIALRENLKDQNRELQQTKFSYLNQAKNLRKLIDMNPLGIISVDNTGNIQVINETYLSYYPDLKKMNLLGQPFRLITQLANFPYEETPLIKALHGQETKKAYIEVFGRKFSISAYPIRDSFDQEILGSIALLQDITEEENLRLEVERMDRLNLVGKMAASLAHEIRNPLTAVRGFVQLMMIKDQKNPSSSLNIVLNELDRTNQIIADFLTLARNRTVIKIKSSLNTIISSIYPLLEAVAIKQDLTIKLDLDKQLPDLLLNEREIKQLLLNLGHNGLEAMEPGHQLTIKTKCQDQKVLLVVIDQGCGIPPEKLDKLFEPFYTTKENGTGLGLPVCWSIAKKHQANIAVQSGQGIGTTFTITFDPDIKESSENHFNHLAS